MTLTSGWPFRAPGAVEPPPMAGVLDKEAALALASVSHGQRNRYPKNQSGKLKPGGKLAIGAKQTAVGGSSAHGHSRQDSSNHKMTSN